MTSTAESTLADISYERLAPPARFRLVVVGSHGGIGSELCRAAEAIGVHVYGVDTERAIAARPDHLAGYCSAIDVRSDTSVEDAFARIGREWDGIDGIAYVTGVGERPMPALDHAPAQWDLTMDVNLRGAFLVARCARPLLKDHASVVFVASGLGVSPEPGFAAYSASKAGLISFARTLAKEWAPIRVNCVAPGLVNTAFLAGGTGNDAPSEVDLQQWFGAERARGILDAIPMRRIAVPADVVAPLLFLLGSGSRFITGQTLHVNGGKLSQ
ncbi:MULTISPECIES: SDR family NAD(P)-dependent oxidoreductase [Cupriavidus]|uniref:SDR family oxidoreductase n=1 Tax=Cupriavidus pauculus TaxID=82633 RepID=A0A5P2H1S1_9BURK|nr:SDR family oxidoreductase [Cupriavidus pauculus]QET01704.1 SDR family oxidoreductase [Cupriavidus pauculus]